MKISTIKSRLVAIQEGIYTVLVFKLEDNSYIMCTRLPNWDCSPITLNDLGYLTYEEVCAGDPYYDPMLEKFRAYNYTNIYFKNFVLYNENINEEIQII